MKRKKRRIKWKRVIGLIFTILIVICLVANIVNKDQSKEKKIENKKIENITPPEEEHSTIKLLMVGDNLIHDKIYNSAYQDGKYDFTKFYSDIKTIASSYDLAYYNQETILGGSEIGVSSYPSFNSPYEVGDAMLDAGFNIVSLATNHTLDRGEKAIINSKNYWNNKEQVLASGSYTSYEEKEKLIIKEKNNIKYTMLNYTYGTNGISIPENKEYLVNIWPVTSTNPNNDIKYQNYKEQVKNDILKVRNEVDLLIVAMHWGIEYETEPNSYQKDMAMYLSSLGVDIIIGTHPHVIQPIEWIDKTLVIYSLGNFFSAHEVINLDNRVGLMSSIDIIKEDNKIKLTNLQNELLYTYYHSNYQDLKVVPYRNMNNEYLENYENIFNKYNNIVKKIDNNIKIGVIE